MLLAGRGNPPDPQCIYALGHVLSGRSPGSSRKPPPSLLNAAVELQPRLADVVLRALVKDPDGRQQSAAALAAEALAVVQRG